MTNSYSNFYNSSNLFHGTLMYAMGTRLDVLIAGPSEKESLTSWTEIKEEIKHLNLLYNKFDESSELFRLNKSASTAPVIVKDELWNILSECKRYHEITLGYFDISLINYDQVIMNEDEHSVFFQNNLIQLDLGAYGKGYALEKIRLIFQKYQIDCALVNFGNSSVLAIGSHPYGDSWPIGIENPLDTKKMLGRIDLKDSTLSTSGNMPSHTSHIVNPHTKIFSTEKKLVSVKTPNAIDAEVLSTSLVISPKENIMTIISNFNVDEYHVFHY